jgi:hypothetical protein
MPLTPEDLQQVQQLLAAAVKPLAEKADQAATAAANAHALAEEAQAKAGTADPAAVKSVVDAAVAEAEESRKTAADAAAAEEARKTAVREKRKGYLDQHAAKIPPAYLAAVPETDEEAALKAAVDAAAAAFQADVSGGRFGVQPASVGATAPAKTAGAQPAASPQQRIADGLMGK